MEQNQDTSVTDTPSQVINPNFDKLVDIQNYKFNFKKDDLGNKRASVELPLKVPSVEGLIDIITVGGKGLELLLEAAASIVIAQARNIVNDNEDISADTIPYDQLSWEFIASIPPKERRGGGIPKETWEAFAVDYVEIMPALTGKKADAIGNHAKIFLNKFSAIKTNKSAIALLKDALAVYISNTTKAEDFAECVEFLVDKADKLLNMTDEDLLKNL